jgi:hypothetical protein
MDLGGFGTTGYMTALGRYNDLEDYVRSIYIAVVSSAVILL